MGKFLFDFKVKVFFLLVGETIQKSLLKYVILFANNSKFIS